MSGTSKHGSVAREEIANASRVVIKAGSSSLTTPEGQIDHKRVIELVDVVASHRARGKQVVLVSSGAIAAGLGPLNLSKRPTDLATAQAAASVGQGILLAAYASRFATHSLGVGQVLLTADDFGRRVHYRNAQRTLNRLLDLGIVPIVNENDTVATDEIRFGDNDRLAALVAHLVRADALVLLSDVDALYTEHPSNPGAQPIYDVAHSGRIDEVDVTGAGSHVGRGGMRTKVAAAAIATDAGIPVLLTSAARAAQALAGEPGGTLFQPTRTRRASRLLWLEHASESRGRILVDAGAVRALTQRNASLLPAGVTAVEGDFEAGDPVDVVSPLGVVIARGLVNYDADEVPTLLGRTTHDLAAELGPMYQRELIHRDDLAIVNDRHVR